MLFCHRLIFRQEISLFNFKEFSTLSKALEKNNIEFLKELEQKIKNKSPQQIKEKKQIISSSKNKEALNIKENLSHSPYN